MPPEPTTSREAGPPAPRHLRLLDQSSADALVCRGCHTRTPRTSYDACAWWPNGCAAREDSAVARPKLCWDCLDEDQRADLVEAGCHPAIMRRRHSRG